MAEIGAECFDDQDCSDPFSLEDSGLQCIGGTCQEARRSAPITPTPTPTPTNTPTPVPQDEVVDIFEGECRFDTDCPNGGTCVVTLNRTLESTELLTDDGVSLNRVENYYTGVCVPPDDIPGCTDPRATNYNPSATVDNGSCTFPPVRGCTDPSALNYESSAEVDDGSCRYPPVDERYSFRLDVRPNIDNAGRVRIGALQGDVDDIDSVLTSTLNNGGAIYQWSSTSSRLLATVNATANPGYRFVGWGTDATNSSTSIQVTISRNSRVSLVAIFEEVIDTPLTYTVSIGDRPDELGTVEFIQGPTDSPSFETTDDPNTIIVTAGTRVTALATPASRDVSLLHWRIYDGRSSRGRILTSNPAANVIVNDNVSLVAIWSEPEDDILGCTNPQADNYNPSATRDDGSCIFPPIRGCTDPEAINFNRQAEEDDGSCTYPESWLSCMDSQVRRGNAPDDYRLVPDVRPGGTTCWEPISEVGFTPSLRDLSFRYRRGSALYPNAVTFTAQNPSYGISYRVRLETNQRLFNVTPNAFIIGPRENQTINIGINKNNIEQFGDGITNFDLILNIEEVGSRQPESPTGGNGQPITPRSTGDQIEIPTGPVTQPVEPRGPQTQPTPPGDVTNRI